MALTQKMLKAMGIEDDQREQILDAHQEVLESIKSERDQYKAEAAKVQDLQRQLEEAKEANADGGDWQEKYESEHKAFESFKEQVAAEKVEADKAKAYRKMLVDTGIDPKRIDSIMRVTDMSKVELGDDGEIKDADKAKEEAKAEWSDFVIQTKTVGAKVDTPPTTTGAAIEGADPEIARRMQARHERLYGKATESKEQS